MIVVNEESALGIDELPILAQEKYLRVKSDIYGWFMNDSYILPFFVDKRLIFKRIVITFALIPLNCSIVDDDTSELEFFDELFYFLKSKYAFNCDFVAQPQSNVFFKKIPEQAEVIPWGSYVVDLTRPLDVIFKSFHTKHKNVIRKAIKENVIINDHADIVTVYGMIRETLRRQNVHAPSMKYYTKLKTLIPNNVLFYSAVLNGVVEGVAVVIYDKNKAYYMYGGSSVHPMSGSINLLQYEVMKNLKNRGVTEYDLVGARLIFDKGSKYEGIQRFKERFASSLLKGYTFQMIFKPFKYKLFVYAVKFYGFIRGFRYEDTIEQTISQLRKSDYEKSVFDI